MNRLITLVLDSNAYFPLRLVPSAHPLHEDCADATIRSGFHIGMSLAVSHISPSGLQHVHDSTISASLPPWKFCLSSSFSAKVSSVLRL